MPARQWVLSVPFELRLLLARDHRALSAVGRIFVREVFRAQRERARALGIAKSRGAAVCFPQRFGGSLNLNVHYHVAVADGVFTLEPHAPRAAFHALPPPDAIDIATIAQNVELRVVAWLQRQGLLGERDDDSADAAPRSALEACLSLPVPACPDPWASGSSSHWDASKSRIPTRLLYPNASAGSSQSLSMSSSTNRPALFSVAIDLGVSGASTATNS